MIFVGSVFGGFGIIDVCEVVVVDVEDFDGVL